MDTALSLLTALAATVFATDLWLDYRRKPRPHIVAYAVGMTMFAVATWAFFVGITFGWTGFVYRTFYLFGAILNIPFLALGSMFLVVGRRSGNVMAIALGAFTAISVTLTATVPFVKPLLAASAGCDPSGPNAASKIGRATWPGSELFANPVRPFARLIARFCCAFLNSSRNPFSKMFTSLKSYARHKLWPRLPT